VGQPKHEAVLKAKEVFKEKEPEVKKDGFSKKSSQPLGENNNKGAS